MCMCIVNVHRRKRVEVRREMCWCRLKSSTAADPDAQHRCVEPQKQQASLYHMRRLLSGYHTRRPPTTWYILHYTSCLGCCTHLGSDLQIAQARHPHCFEIDAAASLPEGYSGPQDQLSHLPQRRKC